MKIYVVIGDYIECGVVAASGPEVAFTSLAKAEAYAEEMEEKNGDQFSYWVREIDLVED